MARSGIAGSWTRWTLVLAVLLISFLPSINASVFSEPAISYCKCICFSNSTIIPLHRPADPSAPCSSCTKQFCLDQNLAICRHAELPELDKDVGTGNEGDVEARCFKRDSPRDELIVTFFALTVFGLLLFAAVRGKLAKAIESRGRPTDLREWTEALLPDRLQPLSATFMDKVSRPRARGDLDEMRQMGGGAGRYEPVNTTA